MDNTALFTAALQLEYPWKVTSVEFLPIGDNSNKMALHITVGFDKAPSSSSTMKMGPYGLMRMATPLNVQRMIPLIALGDTLTSSNTKRIYMRKCRKSVTVRGIARLFRPLGPGKTPVLAMA